MIWKIKAIASLVAVIGLASLIGYGYITINSLEAKLEVKQGQLTEAHNANDVWVATWSQEQEEREKDRKEATRMRKEYARLDSNFGKLKQKQEKHAYEKIMQRKPGAVSKSIINSTNLMFRADEADSQANYAQ